MTRRRSRISDLLLVPILLLVALLAGLTVLRDATVPPPDPGLRVAGLAPPAAEPVRCDLQDEPERLREIAASLEPNGRITSPMVLSCPSAFDGRSVRYVGEVVGETLERDGGAWVLVNDDAYALEVGPLAAHGDHRGLNSGLSVWLRDELLEEVSDLGGPRVRGDVIEVQGVIRRADPADGGGLTLRAERLEVLAPATTVSEPVNVTQAVVAAATLLLGAGLWLLRRRSQRY